MASTEILAVQIIFHMDASVAVRFNGEVRARASVRVNRVIQVGAAVMTTDITEVAALMLTEADADAAHITLVYTGNGQWTIAFNAHYNRSKAAATIAAAREYFQLARYAHKQGLTRGFEDALYSAVELAVKAELLLMPNPQTLRAKSHGYIVARYNARGGKLGNSPAEHVIRKLTFGRRDIGCSAFCAGCSGNRGSRAVARYR